MAGDSGISSQSHRGPGPDAPRGLGDFKQRSNRAERELNRRPWDVPTPTPIRNGRDAPSVRVPNVAWDSTPRRSDARDGGGGGGWGGARDRKWDAPTPKTSREEDEDDEAALVGGREWEEEQVKLDRDWYMGSEGGTLVSVGC